MSKHTNWDAWMTECIRYALLKVPLIKTTYSEYYYNVTKDNRIVKQGIIDIVGKVWPEDSLEDSIVVEIKGSRADINSGHGQNFVGKYNYLATDEAFVNSLLKYYDERLRRQGIGVLLVHADGSVSTVIPALYKQKPLSIENDFSEFDTEDEVEDFFRRVVIPQQKYWDSNKPYYRN